MRSQEGEEEEEAEEAEEEEEEVAVAATTLHGHWHASGLGHDYGLQRKSIWMGRRP